MPVLSEPTGVKQLLPSAVCLVQEAIGTSGASCRCSFPCYQLILCTRLCVHDSRHAAHNGSRTSHVSISHTMAAELVFVHGNTVIFLENRLRQTEEALVAERRATHRTAEVAQQVVRACPAGVDVEEIGRLEMFNGDSDLNGRVSNMHRSQWCLTVRKYFGEFNQTATPLLQRVETNAEDSIITDNTTMTRAETHFQHSCTVCLH